jgi:hypothetical protein
MSLRLEQFSTPREPAGFTIEWSGETMTITLRSIRSHAARAVWMPDGKELPPDAELSTPGARSTCRRLTAGPRDLPRLPVRRGLDESEAAVHLPLSSSFFRKLLSTRWARHMAGGATISFAERAACARCCAATCAGHASPRSGGGPALRLSPQRGWPLRCQRVHDL